MGEVKISAEGGVIRSGKGRMYLGSALIYDGFWEDNEANGSGSLTLFQESSGSDLAVQDGSSWLYTGLLKDGNLDQEGIIYHVSRLQPEQQHQLQQQVVYSGCFVRNVCVDWLREVIRAPFTITDSSSMKVRVEPLSLVINFELDALLQNQQAILQ